MTIILKILIFVSLVYIKKVKSDDDPTTNSAWSKPYFIDAKTDGINWQPATSQGFQMINVREELTTPYKLAKINYNGTSVPMLGAFDIGHNSLLGARINQINSEWFVVIEKRQDYENPQQRIYFFQIYIKDAEEMFTMEQSLFITLENTFDNQPTVTYQPTPCRVKELHSNYLTDCIFIIYDPDGMDRNNIRIEVPESSKENLLFTFEEYGETTTYEKQYQLKILHELHYDEKAIHNLWIKVLDAQNNTGEIFAIVEVIDLPNRDPIWVKPLTTATFNEKEQQSFVLQAIDGDTGINKPICYRLEFEDDYSDLISVNETTGVLHVKPIDRDSLNQQIFSFYTCAYKCDNSSWFIQNSTILIVQDINDHKPEIHITPNVVQILESKYLTVPLQEFYIEDMDLGTNATYNVYFGSDNGSVFLTKAFTMIPNSGYQRTQFSLSVTQTEMLDYEKIEWREFELKIIAQEIENTEHISEQVLKIELINWNDEWPEFDQEAYEIGVYENVTKGEILFQVQAKDKDVDDHVVHSIVGNMTGIQIDPSSGLITLNDSNVFDYERQSLQILQIQAKDSLITEYSQILHTTYAQVRIRIKDVNDETPELRMPRFIVNITENSPALTLITDRIEARDMDSSADLHFHIIWSASYATKSGQEVERFAFENCCILQRDKVTNNLVYGRLIINPKFSAKIDYEQYDAIFLTIKVTDNNQEINEDSSMAVLTIRIDDLNDNAPQFVTGSLDEQRSVTEMEDVQNSLGAIEAYDSDGPGNNNITFQLRPFGNLTLPDLVIVNKTSGVLKVNGAIQCDMPKIENLEYEIMLSDGVFETKGKFHIRIIDINNQKPTIDNFEKQVFLYENATTGEFVGRIRAHDNDRDAPHNVLEYSINSAFGNINQLFQINTTTGEIFLNLRNGLSLDRDHGITFHYIPVDVRDNFNYLNSGYGPVNQVSTFLNVTLLDVNDNAPIMPDNKQLIAEFVENEGKGSKSRSDFIATDIDEANTLNSQIIYNIISIKSDRDNNEDVEDYADLITIETLDNNIGKLITKKSLNGYYGYWNIEIEALDQGEPQCLRNSSLYKIYIKPYNFHNPEIKYPLDQKSIRICYSLQEPHRPLYQADCVSRMSLFEAYDPDGGEYGDVHFEITSDVGHDRNFVLSKESKNTSHLYVKDFVPAGIYFINIRAIDGGGATSMEIRNLKLVFVDMLGNPMFLQNTIEISFTENEEGLLEEQYIPQAYDPKNEGLDNSDESYKLFYFIDDTIYTEDSTLFKLNMETRQLKLNTSLDREVKDEHSLRIKVTNNENGLITNPNSINYTLDVYIKVLDTNDNPPKFNQDLYAAGITATDSLDKKILIFKAEDPDLDDVISYLIDSKSLEAHGNMLSSDLLTLNKESGVLSLGSYVTKNMKGYLHFKIQALDAVGHTGTTWVKIYIVAEENRVRFVFLSDMQKIRENEKFLREQFQEIYNYEICNIDSIEDITNQGSPKEDKRQFTNTTSAFITEVKVHFIHNNEAVEAYDIQKKSNDLAFISRLQNSLQYQNLILNDIPHLQPDPASPLVDNWLMTSLVVLNVFLGITASLILALYLWKTRSLKKQLKAFEPAEFGSVASNLNRLAGPSANVFSVEGSNPVFNKATNEFKQKGVYDNNDSICSSDDDETDEESSEEDEFEGLHNDPLFEMNNMKSFEPKATFEHKILNNEFFSKEKTTNLETDNKRF